MDTLKAERAMSNTDKLREIAVKWCPWSEKTSFKRNGKDYVPFDQMVSDLTALISEHYVEKEKYDEAVRQRGELKDALKQLVHLHGCEQEGLLSGQPTPEQWYKAVEQAEAAIKETER